jgi:hypothetical protein
MGRGSDVSAHSVFRSCRRSFLLGGFLRRTGNILCLSCAIFYKVLKFPNLLLTDWTWLQICEVVTLSPPLRWKGGLRVTPRGSVTRSYPLADPRPSPTCEQGGWKILIKSFTCETLESAPFRASARTSRRRHGTFAPSRNIHVANRDVYHHREPLKPVTWTLRAAAKSPCRGQGRFSQPRKARARRVECSRRRDVSPHAAWDPHGADSLPQGCFARSTNFNHGFARNKKPGLLVPCEIGGTRNILCLSCTVFSKVSYFASEWIGGGKGRDW